jgi:hypothetical protein
MQEIGGHILLLSTMDIVADGGEHVSTLEDA